MNTYNTIVQYRYTCTRVRTRVLYTRLFNTGTRVHVYSHPCMDGLEYPYTTSVHTCIDTLYHGVVQYRYAAINSMLLLPVLYTVPLVGKSTRKNYFFLVSSVFNVFSIRKHGPKPQHLRLRPMSLVCTVSTCSGSPREGKR